MVPPNDERADGGSTADAPSTPSARSSSNPTLDRPSVLRAWRAALDLLNEWEATVLQVRFGIDGGRPRRLPDAARQLGVRPQDFSGVEQKALQKLDQAPPTRPLAIHLANLREDLDRGNFAPPPPPPPEARGPLVPRGFQPSMEPRFIEAPPPRRDPRPRDDRFPPRERFDDRPRFDDRRPPRRDGPWRDERPRPPRATTPPPPPPPPPPPEPEPRVIPPELAPWTDALMLLTERETEVVALRAGLRDQVCPSIAAIARTLGVTRKRAYELHEHAVERLKKKPAGTELARRLEEVARASEEGRPIPPLVIPPMPEIPVLSAPPVATAPTPPPVRSAPVVPPPSAARPAAAPPAAAAPPPLARGVSSPTRRAAPQPEPEIEPEQVIVVRSNSDHDEAVAAVEEALAELRFAAEECKDGPYERLVAPLTELARVVERGAAELRSSGPRG
ncbi:MAG: hypothetical protein JNM84_01175 [Planctomycetes bacterium]|nr:hypothetical protein [Planctomycetota bacterium]